MLICNLFLPEKVYFCIYAPIPATSLVTKLTQTPPNIYLFKVNIRSNIIMYEICSNLTKTPERHHYC